LNLLFLSVINIAWFLTSWLGFSCEKLQFWWRLLPSDEVPQVSYLTIGFCQSGLTIIGRNVGPLDRALSSHVPGPTALDLIPQVSGGEVVSSVAAPCSGEDVSWVLTTCLLHGDLVE
jgi:hypothetical protein